MSSKFVLFRSVVATLVFSAFATTALARVTGNEWFLTHAQFKRLTRTEQKQYLKKVKAVLSSLPEKSEFFGRDDKPKKRSVAEAQASSNPVSMSQLRFMVVQAEQWRGKDPDFATDYSDPKLGSHQRVGSDTQVGYLEQYQNSMQWLTMARAALVHVPEDAPQRATEEKRIKALEDYYKKRKVAFSLTLNKDGKLDPYYKALDKARSGEETYDSPTLLVKNEVVDFKSQKVVRVANKNDEAAPVVHDIGASVIAEEKAAEQEEVPEIGGYRCMYSGFVIKQDPCVGPQSLPEEISFRGIDSAKLTCGEKQVLCNPLLFGLKADCRMGATDEEALKCLAQSQPVCVKSGKYATRDCGRETASDASLESAAALIRLNPSVWSKYMTSFYELCDDKMIVMNEFTVVKDGEPREIPEATLKDVEQTCANAKTRLAKIAQEYTTIDTTRPAKPAASENKEKLPKIDEEDNSNR